MPSISSLPAVEGSPTVEQTMQLLQVIAGARGEIRVYLAASEFGVLLATIFYGANLVQLYIYATAQRRDPLWVILLVIWVWALDTCHTGFIWSWLFDKTVLDSADISRTLHASDLTNALSFSVVFSGLIGASVQCFYAYRLYRLARHPWFSIVSWLGSLARAALSVAVASYARKSQTLLVFVEGNRWLIHGILGLSVGVDVFNTSIVCVLLARHKDGMELTSTMISKLTLWTIETGILTSACALVMLCLELVGKPSTITALLFLYAKLFAFSLLVTLNGRERLRNAIASGASMVSGALSPSRPAVVSVTHHREFKEPGFELVSRTYRVDDREPPVKGRYPEIDSTGTLHPDIRAVAPWEGIDPVVPRSQTQTLRSIS